MAKMALTFPAHLAPYMVEQVRESKGSSLITQENIINQVLSMPVDKLSLSDREFCETDHSLLQLIPYIAAFNLKGQVFAYGRGDESGEKRLAGKLSIGLGGHVDELPAPGETLESLLRREAVRELMEEAGFKLDPSELHIVGLLVNAQTPQDIVHLGILCIYHVPEGTEIIAEANVIEKGEFMDIHHLNAAAFYDRLENWSKLAVEYFNNATPGEQ